MCLFKALETHDINDMCIIDGAAGQCWVSFLVVFTGREGNVMFTLNAVKKKKKRAIGIIVAKLSSKVFYSG